MISEVMDQRLTLPLGILLRLAPGLQRDLGRVVRGPTVGEVKVASRAMDTEANKESAVAVATKSIYLQEERQAWSLGLPRDDLLKVEV